MMEQGIKVTVAAVVIPDANTSPIPLTRKPFTIHSHSSFGRFRRMRMPPTTRDLSALPRLRSPIIG